MSELKPSIEQMIQVGKDCGLSTLEEAYNNYMNHYDCFFLIEKFHEQLRVFAVDLALAGLLEEVEDNKVNVIDKLLSDI